MVMLLRGLSLTLVLSFSLSSLFSLKGSEAFKHPNICYSPKQLYPRQTEGGWDLPESHTFLLHWYKISEEYCSWVDLHCIALQNDNIVLWILPFSLLCLLPCHHSSHGIQNPLWKSNLYPFSKKKSESISISKGVRYEENVLDLYWKLAMLDLVGPTEGLGNMLCILHVSLSLDNLGKPSHLKTLAKI